MMELTHEGKTLTVANWSRLRGLNPETVRVRKKRGWSDAQCLGFADPPPRYTLDNLKIGKPLSVKKNCNPPEELKLATRLVEVIDSLTIAIEAKRIRRGCGVTQEEAAQCMGFSTYGLLESGHKPWTADLVARFNRVAAGWVVSNDQTND
jgi:hypothetical protein